MSTNKVGSKPQSFFMAPSIQGGRIDHAHHDSWANTALDETISLDLAIETAFNMTNPEETLIIVTADHGHTMSFAGKNL
jgi:alkaline phosphatase